MAPGEFADLGNVRMHYEGSGDGAPLLLLHGGFGGVHVFGGQIPLFSEHYRVLVPEFRGRGHTADVEGPITYKAMADDVIEFIGHLAVERANLVGVSDGGIIGLLVALDRSDLVNKLVVVGSNFHPDGLVDSALWTDASPDDESWAGPRRHYSSVSPDGPDHFPVVFAKLQHMWRQGQPRLSVEDLAGITIPVLVVAGDDDVVDHRHTVEFYEALPDGQLAVIPGASHGVFMEKPDLFNEIVLGFLAEEHPPETMLPIRRARRPEIG